MHITTAHRLKINMLCTYSACSKMFSKIKLTMKFYMLSNCLWSSERAASYLRSQQLYTCSITSDFGSLQCHHQKIWTGLRSDDKMTVSLDWALKIR